MSGFTKLPCEIIISVLRDLDNVRYLLPSLLICRHVYSCFKENPGIAADLLQRQIPAAIMPYSIAVLEASRLGLQDEAAVHELLETLHTEPSKITERIRTVSVPFLAKVGHTHEVIHKISTRFASSAWLHLSKDTGSRVAGRLALSPTEYIRFCRAFYRVELYFVLYRCKVSLTAVLSHEHLFFSKQPPWEKEQLASALDFLELLFHIASRDVLDHDVEFGELGIDCISSGENNYFTQLWGVEFVDRLMTERSFDGQKALLKSAFGGDTADLYDALMIPPEPELDHVTPLSEYAEEELAGLFPPTNSQDTNDGPFEAWRLAFNHWPRRAWVMLSINAGLRERAYVFWDADRIQRYELLKLFENAPEPSELQYTNDNFDDMYESFEELSKLWQKGGSGY